MALKIYKPGEGYWTRTLTWIGSGTLVLSGILYIWDQMSVITTNTAYWQGGMAISMVVFWGCLLYWILNKKNVVEFFISTEAEMKKVNWPSRKEVMGSTIVVIGGTIFLALLLLAIQIVFAKAFTWMGVLQGG
ncbi:MAG: preprotein translocase subunit SecE [Desulfobacterales bacterium]|nr:preprotein translocase subunit SecE [Desulfobacterales bacterium]